ncbi:cysteine dioxygenase type I, partial [Ramicandelaber brevisporus]
QLVSGLRDYLGTGGLTSAGVDVSYIVQLMNGYNSNPVEWQRFALFDKYRYTRNLVDAGVEGAEYNLIVLCWGPGHQSAIHDHANSHCVMKVLSGNLTETRYAWPNPNEATPSEVSDEDAKSMEVMQKMTLGKDEVTYIHDRIGLHRVSNASDSEPAVSLHLYSPPIRICKMFNERTGAARAVSCQVFFSKDGVRI